MSENQAKSLAGRLESITSVLKQGQVNQFALSGIRKELGKVYRDLGDIAVQS